jgi:hypothetical protein
MSFPLLDRRKPSRVARRALLPGSYLTDGRTLFRVTSRVALKRRVAVISLEDCRTLATQLYATNELDLIGLQPVPIGRRVAAVEDGDRHVYEFPPGPADYQHQPRISPAGMKL